LENLGVEGGTRWWIWKV